MVEFSDLSPSAREQVLRILRGRPPEQNKAALNQAIDFINANPSLRKQVEGGLPTGFDPKLSPTTDPKTISRREAFLEQEQERISQRQGGISPERQRDLEAISRISQSRIQALEAAKKRDVERRQELTQSFQQREQQQRILTPSPTPTPPPKDIMIRGDTVFIEGKGFSVAPTKQATFIRQRTGEIVSVKSGKIQTTSQGRVILEKPKVPEPIREDRPDGFRILPSERERRLSTADIIKGRFGDVGELAKQGGGFVKDFLFKDLNIPIFSLGVPGARGGSVPREEISKGLVKEFGTTGAVLDILIPRTVGGAVIFGAIPTALRLSPKIVRIGAGATFGVLGGKTALDPTALLPERIVGGGIAILGLGGATIEALPFIKGGIARFDPRTRLPKTQPEGFKGIELPKGTLETPTKSKDIKRVLASE